MQKTQVDRRKSRFSDGLGEFISRNQPIIFSEMLRKWSAKSGYTPNDIIKPMEELGYGCFVIADGQRLQECPLVDENTVETNYFFYTGLSTET